MLQISTMKSTKFVEPFAKEVDYWERTLSYIMETLETALGVQRQWLYLEVSIKFYFDWTLQLNLSLETSISSYLPRRKRSIS